MAAHKFVHATSHKLFGSCDGRPRSTTKNLTLFMENVISAPAAWALCCAAVLAGGALLLVVAPPPRCVSDSCARAGLVVPGPLASSGALPGLALVRAAASAARRPRPARCPHGHARPRGVGLSPSPPGPWAPRPRPAPTKSVNLSLCRIFESAKFEILTHTGEFVFVFCCSELSASTAEWCRCPHTRVRGVSAVTEKSGSVWIGLHARAAAGSCSCSMRLCWLLPTCPPRWVCGRCLE